MVKFETISHAVKKAIQSIVSQSPGDSETSNIIESDFEHEKYKDKLGKPSLLMIYISLLLIVQKFKSGIALIQQNRRHFCNCSRRHVAAGVDEVLFFRETNRLVQHT